MTAVVQGPEAVAEAHVATLTAHLAAEMTTVWSAWNDTVPQPTFAVIVPTDISEEQHDYPAISVVAEMGEVVEDGTPNWQLMTYHVRVLVYLTSDQIETLQKMMMRTLTAIKRTLMHNPNLDGSLAGYSGTSTGQMVLFDVMRRRASTQLLQVGGLHAKTAVAETY